MSKRKDDCDFVVMVFSFVAVDSIRKTAALLPIGERLFPARLCVVAHRQALSQDVYSSSLSFYFHQYLIRRLDQANNLLLRRL